MSDTSVFIYPNVATVITSETQGPPGVGYTSTLQIAGENIGSNSGVIISGSKIIKANNTILSHVGKLIGIVAGAVSINATIPVLSNGELDGFYGLTVDSKVYLQTNGIISSTLPTTGFIQQVGIALSSTKILINIQTPILLG